jgi:ribulose-phosphate 3-epimerase
MKAGVAINPGTSLSSLDAVLGEVDYILVMSVNPGFGGQAFVPSSLDRIRELKKRLELGQFDAEIEIDGGIKDHNIGSVVGAGAEIIVVGTGLFALKDYASAIRLLKAKGKESG